MATDAKFKAEFLLPLMEGVQTILEQRVNDYVGEFENLKPFEDYRTPADIAMRFPVLFVAPIRIEVKQSADDSRLEIEAELVIECAATGPDAYTLARDVQKYAIAIDRCLRSAIPAEEEGGLMVSANRSRPVWEITEHVFALRKNETQMRADAQLTLVIQFIEV